MSESEETPFGRCAWAGAAIMVLAWLVSTEAPATAHSLTPAAILAAARAAVTSPARAMPTNPLQQAALHPSGAPPVPPAAACGAPPHSDHFDHPLFRTMRRLASGKPLIVVAIGSSSTAGAGASSPAASYPSRLAVELRTRLPGHAVIVLNRGVDGEETADMMARFATGVIAKRPQLVLWQLGTNSVLRDHPLRPHSVLLREGIAELRATGADVVLIDPQYAPKVLAKSETAGMLHLIALVAKDENINLFRRFAVMRNWYEIQHRSFRVFLSADKLHMNDWGYACWAKLLAAAIAEAATSPMASAAAQREH